MCPATTSPLHLPTSLNMSGAYEMEQVKHIQGKMTFNAQVLRMRAEHPAFCIRLYAIAHSRSLEALAASRQDTLSQAMGLSKVLPGRSAWMDSRTFRHSITLGTVASPSNTRVY